MIRHIGEMLREILSVTRKIDFDAAEERTRASEQDELQGLAMERLERQLELLRRWQEVAARGGRGSGSSKGEDKGKDNTRRTGEQRT